MYSSNHIHRIFSRLWIQQRHDDTVNYSMPSTHKTTLMKQYLALSCFQGTGGADLFALSFVLVPEIVSASEYGLYVAIITATQTLSNLMGPLVGGFVNHNVDDNKAWQWIFFLK
jgi:MFS family permease